MEREALSFLADFQSGKGAGKTLFPRRIRYTCSKHLRRPKTIFDETGVIVTLSTKAGILILNSEGAKRLHRRFKSPKLRVLVKSEVEFFIREGRSVFCKHVKELDASLRPGDEALTVDQSDQLLGYGRLILPPELTNGLKRGVAVKVRGGLVLEQENCLRQVTLCCN